jgi:hypothetical protein
MPLVVSGMNSILTLRISVVAFAISTRIGRVDHYGYNGFVMEEPPVSEAEDIEQCGAYLSPSRFGEAGDNWTKPDALDDANPFRFQDARRGKAIDGAQRHLPSKATNLR